MKRVLLSDPTTHLAETHIQDMVLLHKHRPMLEALVAVGGEPVKVEVVTMLRTFGRFQVEDYDAVILLGGDDIQAAYYDGSADPAQKDTLAGQVDAAEFALALSAKEHGIPLLGVCRGSQMLNIALGGNLIQEVSHISTLPHRHDTSNPEYLSWASSHPVNITGSRLLEDGTYLVSSRHHQAVGKLGHGLHATGVAPDGIIEMIEHESLPLFGIQWHPEASYVEQTDTLEPILKALLK